MKLPGIGNVKVLTLVTLPLAFIFAGVWVATMNSSFGWVGQNLMVSYAGTFARSSVFVFTDTVLLHSGHLYDDSCAASGPYAKHKSMGVPWFKKLSSQYSVSSALACLQH